MNRGENIEVIRRACVAANPDKNWPEDFAGSEIQPSLADMLLAIEKTRDYETAFGGIAALCLPKSPFGNVRWYLLKDSLTDQNDECLSFLADLLTPDNKG